MLSTNRPIYTVSQLNRAVRNLLENEFPPIWIEGEISNFKKLGSGHSYFSLKDAAAQIRCALFKNRLSTLTFEPKNGMHVLLQARVSLYEERGDFQLIVEYLEETGDGALRRAFELLKKRLSEEGLFAATHKKTLPKLPQCIGIVTSPTGAAIRDIVSILKRRFPAIPILIYPTQVQGSEAAGKITQALKCANRRQECDVLILARGGGSLEDLWPFNEEIVARAIYNSTIPIVSGIGHEIDFTIADFVADQRAATPSAAAELVSPDSTEWLNHFLHVRMRLVANIRNILSHTQLLLTHLEKRLPHPQRRLQDQAQRLDRLEQQLLSAYSHALHRCTSSLNQLLSKLMRYIPSHTLQRFILQCANAEQRLKIGMQHHLNTKKRHLENLLRALDGVSPLHTLSRGYSLALKNKEVITSIDQVAVGDCISVQLEQGLLECRIQKKIRLD